MTTRAQALVPITIAAVIIGIVGLLSIPSESKLESVEFPRGTVLLDGVALDVQVADTEPRRVRGLMFQDPLPATEGMIFVFEEPAPHSIWMLNMQFALDIVWFDAAGRVVHIEQGVPPCRTALEITTCESTVPAGDALYVLEVAAGFVERHGITADSVLEIVSI